MAYNITKERYNNMKKIFTILTFALLLSLFSIPVHAETFKLFNLSSKTKYVDYKENGSTDYVVKNGGSKYENVFYLTPTYFSRKGNAYFRSVKKGDSSVCTYALNVAYGGENVPRSKYYKKNAPAGAKYMLQAKRGTTDGDKGIKISGRWTP